ncbi:MAG: hypothetical protein DRJ32_04895 [Thermoprotei archaeon]|nr:MAG: hypothetical protein B6U94_07680 [Thermofilum sp. ex4484_79]RLE59308.1 MAG: hypothetical protein DRJ32_04895 [Thermoprotei archaeon]
MYGITLVLGYGFKPLIYTLRYIEKRKCYALLISDTIISYIPKKMDLLIIYHADEIIADPFKRIPNINNYDAIAVNLNRVLQHIQLRCGYSFAMKVFRRFIQKMEIFARIYNMDLLVISHLRNSGRQHSTSYINPNAMRLKKVVFVV